MRWSISLPGRPRMSSQAWAQMGANCSPESPIDAISASQPAIHLPATRNGTENQPALSITSNLCSCVLCFRQIMHNFSAGKRSFFIHCCKKNGIGMHSGKKMDGDYLHQVGTYGHPRWINVTCPCIIIQCMRLLHKLSSSSSWKEKTTALMR